MPALLLAAALAFTARDAQFSHDQAASLVSCCTPRDAGTAGGRAAADHIFNAVRAAGADVRRDRFRAMTSVGEREFVNLEAAFRSDDPGAPWVILLSHYDTKPGCGCPGANDGAATTGLLIALARLLSERKDPKGNLLLVWTDGEECLNAYGPTDGFWGSKRAAERVSQRKLGVRAVICLDMLGDRDLSITVPANGSPRLAGIARQAAERIGRPGLVTRMDGIVKDDHVAFLDRGYPAVDLIDFSYGPGNAYWHTPRDTMDKVSVESLFKSGQLVVGMLNVLL